MYMVVMAGDKSSATCTLDMSKADYAYIYKPIAGRNDMEMRKQKTDNGKVTVTATGTPVFVTSFECK